MIRIWFLYLRVLFTLCIGLHMFFDDKLRYLAKPYDSSQTTLDYVYRGNDLSMLNPNPRSKASLQYWQWILRWQNPQRYLASGRIDHEFDAFPAFPSMAATRSFSGGCDSVASPPKPCVTYENQYVRTVKCLKRIPRSSKSLPRALRTNQEASKKLLGGPQEFPQRSQEASKKA